MNALQKSTIFPPQVISLWTLNYFKATYSALYEWRSHRDLEYETLKFYCVIILSDGGILTANNSRNLNYPIFYRSFVVSPAPFTFHSASWFYFSLEQNNNSWLMTCRKTFSDVNQKYDWGEKTIRKDSNLLFPLSREPLLLLKIVSFLSFSSLDCNAPENH